MSNHIYLGNIKNKKKIKFISKLTLGIFIVFSAVYLYMASTIGIYVDGEFLKKSPSLITINYYAVSASSPIQNIQLTNNIDESYTIIIDEETLVISNIEYISDSSTYNFDVIEGEVVNNELLGINLDELAQIALQKNEIRRQPIYLYIIPLILLIIMALIRKYSTEIHNKIFKGKVFSDKYFSFIDYLPIYTAYIVIALLTISL